MAKTVTRTCPICDEEFEIDESRLKHGRGKTCSKECRDELVSRKQKKGETMDCPVCGKSFYCSPSRLKSAKYTPVCSRECLYEARKLDVVEREVEDDYDISPTLVDKTCETCDQEFVVELADKDHKYCSRECFEEAHSENMQGENNPSWIDGRSYDKRCYRGANWKEIRKKVYERDNYTCRICNTKCIGRRDLSDKNSDRLIQCHHIERYEKDENNSLDNLVTLCASCHTKVHENKLEVENV